MSDHLLRLAKIVSHMFAGPPEYRTETLQQAAHDAELLRDLEPVRSYLVTPATPTHQPMKGQTP